MRVLFMGSPQEAVAPLKKLLEMHREKGIELLGVVSQARKPKGRGLAMAETPVSQFARSKDIELYLPAMASAPDFVSFLGGLNVDVILTAAYGQILSAEFLATARRGVINIHPSLLPHLRGATPVVAAVLAGEKEIGVTVCFTVEELDAGNIIAQKSFPLPTGKNHLEVTADMFAAGAELLPHVFSLLADSSFCGTAQNPKLVTTCTKLRKESGLINWHDSANSIYRKYLAYYGWPEIFTYLSEKRIILKEVAVLSSSVNNSDSAYGEFVFDHQNNALRVRACEGWVLVRSLQAAGRKTVDARSFWNGVASKGGFKFSSDNCGSLGS